VVNYTVPDGVQFSPVTFEIQAINALGEKQTTGGDSFTVLVAGPALYGPSPRDNKNGTYNVTFTPTVPGNFSVTITLDKLPIEDSPYSTSIAGVLPFSFFPFFFM
jgi:hypothetical protein